MAITIKILDPKGVEWVSSNMMSKEMKYENRSSYLKLLRRLDRRKYSTFYHQSKGYQMVTNYEKEHKLKFDWVVAADLNSAWVRPVMPISMYRSDRVWLPERG